jgi:hypothetical protein
MGGIPGVSPAFFAITIFFHGATEYWITAFAEYPSGSTGLCSAHATAIKALLGTDRLNLKIRFPKGSSLVEPGLTPRRDIDYHVKTWYFEILYLVF